MRVGLLTASVSRRSGGLSYAVRRLAGSLETAGEAEVHVFALEDHDTGLDLSAWNGTSVRVFSVRGTRAVGYAPGLMAALEAADLDLLHVHGLWQYPSLGSLRWGRRSGRPVAVSPHGMLDPWALRQSAWKKRIARWLYENRHLKRAACLHAVSRSEAESIRHCGFRSPICIIPNAVDLPGDDTGAPPPWQRQVPDGARVLLYLGRIHPKKNITGLIQGWRRVAASGLDDWWLVIAGWDQSGHETELRELVRARAIPRVAFVGPQFGADKHATLRRAEAFVLASHSEGLPVAVLEAWAYGLPVIMTPACNLPDGFRAGAAIAVSADPKGIQEGLVLLLHGAEGQRRTMGAAGRALVEREFTWPVVSRRMAAMYRRLLSSGHPSEVMWTECEIDDGMSVNGSARQWT